jgi:uncharacterized DUF497 family protein
LLVEDTKSGGTMFPHFLPHFVPSSETLFFLIKPEGWMSQAPWNKGYPEATFDQLLVSRSIMKLEFEWHAAKAEANFRRHGVSFDLAKTVFNDPFAVDFLDDREEYGEERFVMIGMAEGKALLFVAYTEREKHVRIISARRTTQYEQDEYFQQNA